MSISKISASLVMYENDVEKISKVIKSTLKSSILERFYVIDNSQTDRLKSIVSIDPLVEYIHCPENLGFGGGHNIAFRKSIELGVKHHAIINPDIFFSDKVLEELSGFLDKNEDIGATMPKILYPNGEIQRLCKLYPTPFNLIFRRFLPSGSLKEKMDYQYEMHFFDYNTIADIPLLSGSFMLFRTDVFKAGCFFDERYFMYLEDYDLCRSIRNAGWRLVYNPTVEVYHEFEKGSHKNTKLLKYHVSSAIKYFNKWGWFFDKERRGINQKYK